MTGALLICLVIASAGAQARPDFSGAWVEDVNERQTTVKVESGTNMVAAPPRPITVTQSADALDVQHEAPMPGLNQRRYVYHFSGREDVNRNGANTQTTRSRWEGATLVTEGTSYSETTAGESLWKLRETRALDAKGRMIVETRLIDEAGRTTITRRTFDRRK